MPIGPKVKGPTLIINLTSWELANQKILKISNLKVVRSLGIGNDIWQSIGPLKSGKWKTTQVGQAKATQIVQTSLHLSME